MKKAYIILATICIAALSCVAFTSCDEASYVRENLAQEADNFNCFRRITVTNCVTNDTLYCIEGFCSITADNTDNQLEILVEDGYNSYKKIIVGLGDNTSYVVEDLSAEHVAKYYYEINFNPQLWIPNLPTYID